MTAQQCSEVVLVLATVSVVTRLRCGACRAGRGDAMAAV